MSRIGIIGAGISGLVAAHGLAADHDVTVFESEAHVGGHTNTRTVELDGRTWSIDTGFIVYNDRTYPEFIRLLNELGVETQPSSMSFSVRCDRRGLEYNGTSLNGLFAQRRNLVRPRFLGMVRDIIRFHRIALGAIDALDEHETVEAWVGAQRLGAGFFEDYLVPMGASIWSCPPGTFRRFPIRFVLEFMRNHGMLTVNDRPEWRVIRGGSARYVAPLTARFRDAIHVATPVRSIRRTADGVRIRTDRDEARFDHVVVACHADQALALLEDPSPTERELLGAFPYQRNEAALHLDTSVLPRRRRAWASWNYHRRIENPDEVTVTYDMNILQGLASDRTFCVTLNDTARLDPDLVIERFVYHHPVYRPDRAAAQRRHGELIGANRTSFCGAYWGYGFHEDGVRSGLAVARGLGA